MGVQEVIDNVQARIKELEEWIDALQQDALIRAQRQASLHSQLQTQQVASSKTPAVR